MTNSQKERTEKMMTEYAGEKIEIQKIDDTLYVYGSEIACLRIYKKYMGKVECNFSTNLDTWYIALTFKYHFKS